MGDTQTDSRPVALITGCSEPKSLGASIAVALAGKGYKVIATARNQRSLDFLKDVCEVSSPRRFLDHHRARIHNYTLLTITDQTLELDVSKDASRKAAVEAVRILTGGRLSVLVNNVSSCFSVYPEETLMALFPW